MKAKLLILGLVMWIGSFGQSSVPDTDTFTFSNVANIVFSPAYGGTVGLSEAFTNATTAYFDSNYNNDSYAPANSLKRFRNYGIFAPTITTTAITSITDTAAISGGNVTFDGRSSISDRGICWSTSANPTITDSHTHDGTGTGSFTSSITGLIQNTTYHVRAWAENSLYRSYGSDINFTTACVTRPEGLTDYSRYHSTTNGGIVDFTGSFANACTALNHYVYDNYTLNGAGVEAANLNVNTDVYMGWGATDCTKSSDGYYIIVASGGSITINTPITHIQGGKIVSSEVCPQ